MNAHDMDARTFRMNILMAVALAPLPLLLLSGWAQVFMALILVLLVGASVTFRVMTVNRKKKELEG